MAEKPLRETINYLMVQVSRALRSRTAVEQVKLGLHVGQEMVLLHLWGEDGLSQTELVERLGVEPPTLTKMLNRMEKVDLIKRKRDLQDGRVCRVYLTDAGRSLQEPVHRCWIAIEEQVLANLTLEERLLFRRLLLQVHSNLD